MKHDETDSSFRGKMNGEEFGGGSSHDRNGHGADSNFFGEDIYKEKLAKKKSIGMGLRFRTGSEGFWVAFLLPLCIYLSDLKFQSQSFTAVAVISVNSFFLCVFCWMELNLALLLQRLRKINWVFTCVVMLICLAQGGNVYEFASYVALNFTFPYLFYNIVKHHPRSFTFGEAVLVVSAFVYKFWSASQKIPFPPTPVITQEEPVHVTLFLQGIFFVTILGSRIFLLLQKPWKLFILEEMYCLWSKYCCIAFYTRVANQGDEVLWFLALWPFKFLIASTLRVYLISYWAVISALTGAYVILKSSSSQAATTVDRKVFHFLIVAVFLPGLMYDYTLIYCCSGVLFYIFILLETIRVLKLEILGIKIGETLDQTVQGFRDYQDEGKLILTHIYLLVGCSLPIWLTGLTQENPNDLKPIEYAACLVGILSIGIGDTFASIGGTYYGRTHWKNSRKTVEGTICSIIAQVVAVSLIFVLGLMPYNSVSVAALIVGVVVNAVIEGNTDQIDNLVLPLATFIVVHIFNNVFSEPQSLLLRRE